jgi:hypothetical protein
MRAADLVTASVLMLLGGVVLYDAVRLGVRWGTDGPGSGFFPFWLAVTLLASCTLIVVQALRRPPSRPFVTRAQLVPVLKVLAPAVALVLAMQVVGLYVASGLYIATYMRWIGHHRWATIAVVSVAIPVAAFFIFETWFLVPMPKGPLEDWLGY